MYRITFPPTIFVNVLVNAAINQTSPYYILAIAWQESGFRWDAIGDDGKSFGLMQLHVEGAGHGHTAEELLDISNNLRIGAEYLKRCLLAVGNRFDQAASAYNQGIASWQAHGDSVNRNYVDAALRCYDRLIRAEFRIGSDFGGLWPVGIEEV